MHEIILEIAFKNLIFCLQNSISIFKTIYKISCKLKTDFWNKYYSLAL